MKIIPMIKEKVYRAGVIPYIVENQQIKMMFMKPSDSEWGGTEFQLGKGKVEEGEGTKDAALREAGEELGLFKSNILHLEELGVFLGRTTVFIAKIKDKEMFGQPNFETEETAWLTAEEFAAVGRSLHKDMVQVAYRKILELEQIL
jgi:8-oxo-dGTP pyrophosphatase MutT (NUDIX family)